MRKPWTLVPSAAVNQKDSIWGEIELGEEGVVEVSDLYQCVATVERAGRITCVGHELPVMS